MRREDVAESLPDAYVEANRKIVPAEDFEAWEQGVRSLYERTVVVTVAPDWAKLLAFETTIPKAVEDLVPARQER
jgi:hypothetical protein